MSRDAHAQSKLAMTMADDRPLDFGTFLRQAREQHGVSLQQLSVTTKISARVLESLERNDPSKLPGGIFSRAFVRAYAREVGLDPDMAVASFVSAFPAESGADEMPATTRAVEVESFEHRRRVVRASARALGALLLVAIVAYIAYAGFGMGARLAGTDGALSSATGATERPTPARSEGLPPSPQAAAPAPPPASDLVPAAAPPVATPGTAGGALGSTPGTAPEQPAALVVAFTVNDPCWMSVSVDGTRVPSRTAFAGERIEFAVQRSLTLTVGNAGALAVTLNGKPARALGGAGEVVTTTIPASGFERFLR